MLPDRPQAPGYLANLMARLFHEVSGAGLRPLGIQPEQFPFLVELWFSGTDVTRESLRRTQEMEGPEVEAMLSRLAADGLIVQVPENLNKKIVLTPKATAARDAAIAAARRANQAAAGALSEAEMAQFLALTNRVIDALQAAKRS